MTPASASVRAVFSDVAPQSLSFFRITFLRIKGIGGKKAMLIFSFTMTQK
jgi:hypothetical protein